MTQNGFQIIMISLLRLLKTKKFGDLIYCHVQKKRKQCIKTQIMTNVEFGNLGICQ